LGKTAWGTRTPSYTSKPPDGETLARRRLAL